MSDRDEKRLMRLLVLSWFLVILLLIGIVAFFSFKIGTSDSYAAVTRKQVIQNAQNVEKLQGIVESLAEQSRIPGPKGEDGVDSVSTHTVVENHTIEKTPIKGDKGEPFKYEDFTPEQLESLRGKDARQPVLCMLATGLVGWRFRDSTICLELGP